MDSHGVLRSMSIPVSAVVAIVVLWLAGCASTISPQQLDRMSERSYTALLTDASKKGVLNTDEELTARVRTVASRILPQTAVFRPDAPDWKWEVNVVDRSELDAFCMPGGQIVFNTGIIRGLVLTDDEIAVMMGHVIAHLLRGHVRERVSQALASQSEIGAAGAAPPAEGASDAAATAYKELLATRFSRSDEAEADRIGLELAARAGFDPGAGVTLWQKLILADQDEQQSPEFLDTHPAGARRIEEIQALLPELTPLYKQARK